MSDALLWAGAGGAVAFVIVFLIDGATRTGYSVRRHPVSALALGPRGWLQTTNFLVCGALVTAGGLGLFLAAPSTGAHAGAAAVAVIGIALVGSSVPMDPMRAYPPGTPEGDPESHSRAHQVHDWFGATIFFGLPLIALAHVVLLDDPVARAVSALAGVGTAMLSGWFGVAWERDDPNTGLIQRAFLVVALGWLAYLFASSIS